MDKKEICRVIDLLTSGKRINQLSQKDRYIYYQWVSTWPVGARSQVSSQYRRMNPSSVPRTLILDDLYEIAEPNLLNRESILRQGVKPDPDYVLDTTSLPGWEPVSYQDLIWKQYRERRLWVLGMQFAYFNSKTNKFGSFVCDVNRLKQGDVNAANL